MANVNSFCEIFKKKWPEYRKKLLGRDPTVLYYINDLGKHLKCSFNIAVGSINDEILPCFNSAIELIISPNCCRTNIEEMNALYEKLKDLEGLTVTKWTKRKKINKIEFKNLQVSSDEFEFVHINQDKLHLIIKVDKKIADKVLEKKKVAFETGSSREVYLPKLYGDCYPLDVVVIYSCGEYEFVNLVGYVEYLPSSHELAKNDKMQKIDLLPSIVELLVKDKPRCQVCNRYEWQCDLEKCDCGKYYCSNLCRLANKEVHDLFCKK